VLEALICAAAFSGNAVIANPLQCEHNVRAYNIGQMVNADVRRRETRFYILEGPDHMFDFAPGLKCAPKKGLRYRPNKVGEYLFSLHSAQECQWAITNYMTDYNQTMAKLHPQTLRSNCQRQGKIDPKADHMDIDGYRERIKAGR
jgi:hypothetical protein